MFIISLIYKLFVIMCSIHYMTDMYKLTGTRLDENLRVVNKILNY